MEEIIEFVGNEIHKLVDDKNNNITHIAIIAEKQLTPTFIIKQTDEDDIVIRGYGDMEKFIKSYIKQKS